jgi:hypothetical protein
LWQLEQVLSANLACLAGQEMVLVDFGSTDGLSSWVWSNFEDAIAEKRLVFFEVPDVAWNVSKAKNLAHRLAGGDYLFNLDADNFVTPADIDLIREAVALGISCQQWAGDLKDGSYGRIGIPRLLFERLGGYDEGMLPMGAQDVDLMRRIIAAGERLVRIEPPTIPAIANSTAQKVAEVAAAASDPGSLYRKMTGINLAISELKLQLEGPFRSGGYSSFVGKLNGRAVSIDGFGRVTALDA